MELEIFVLVLYYMRDMKKFEGKKSSGGQTKKEEQSNEKKYQKQYEYLKEIKNIAIKLAISNFHLLLCILTVTYAKYLYKNLHCI